MKKLLLLFFVFALLSCSTEDLSNRTLLLSGETLKSWQVVSIKRDNKEGVPLDCISDDTETFYSNLTYAYDHGKKSCNNQSNLDGTWSINEDFTTLTIAYDDGNIFPTTYNIVSMSKDEMVLEENSFYNTFYTYKRVK